jgi:hypothetical protein
MDQASFYQLVFGAAIMTDKARLLAGESTHNVGVEWEIAALEKVCEMLRQSLISPEKIAIDVTPPSPKQIPD